MSISKNSVLFIPVATIILAFLSALSPFAIDTYLAAMPTMADFFGVPINKIELTISIYFLFFAFGQFIGGPISDVVGRKPIAYIGLILYGVSSFFMAETHSFEMLLLFRALQAFGGGFASVVNMAIVRDYFDGKQLARLSSLIGMIMMLAPMLAPIAGTVLLQTFGWQSIFIFLCGVAVFIFIIFSTLIPESNPKIPNRSDFSTSALFGRYLPIFQSKSAVLLILALSFSNAGMFTFVTGASFVYLEFFSIEVDMFPLLFGTNVLLNIILTLFNVRLLKRFSITTLVRFGLVMQLFSASSLVFTCLQNEPSFWIVFISIACFIGSLGMIFGNTVAMIMHQFGNIGGAANAVIGVSRFVMSALVGVILSLFHTGDLKPMGIIMFICTCLANMLFFFYIKYYVKPSAQ